MDLKPRSNFTSSATAGKNIVSSLGCFLGKLPGNIQTAQRTQVKPEKVRASRVAGLVCLLATGLIGGGLANAKAVGSTTTLAITSGGSSVSTVAAGTVVKLTASVLEGSSLINTGLVNFCNAAAANCTDVNLIGTAQLTGAGTASINFIPGNGNHSYKAVFIGTNSLSGSSSLSASLAVTPLSLAPYPTTAAISSTGSAGNYTLTATVVGTGSANTPITGNVNFLDVTAGNTSVGSAAVGTSTPGLNFTVNNFVSPCGYNSGLVVADFNGDGIPDIATSCGASMNYHDNSGLYLQVYLGTGGGNMAAPVHYLVGNDSNSTSTSLAVADVNGDGIPDLVYFNDSYNQVSVLLGDGDGTFQTPKNTSVGNQPVSLVVGDFNGDGKVDVAVTSNSDSLVYILLGNGDGTFTVQTKTYPTNPNGIPMVIVAGDFNNDGKLDIAFSSWGNNTITILLGVGDGTFNIVPVTLSTGNQPYSIVAADFNGDGNLDLATGNNVDNSVSVFLGNGDGTFTAAPMPNALFDRPTSLAVADFNGDGIPDLAVVNFSYVNSAQNSSNMLLGNGDGTFTFVGIATINSNTQAINSNNPFVVFAADMNGDGIPDVVMATGGDRQSLTVDITTPIETATAALSNVSPAGTGTHNVDASYPTTASYTTSTSSTTPLQAELSTAVTKFVITALPSTGTAGVGNAFTVAAYSGNAADTTYTGTITLSSSQDSNIAFAGGGSTYTFTSGDAGAHVFTANTGAVFQKAGVDTLSVTDTSVSVSASSSNITISAGAAALNTAKGGASQSAVIGASFPTALSVLVTDLYGNPISGNVVTFTAPSSGASATLSSSTCTTGSAGTCSVTATANGLASATAYTVSAKGAGTTTAASFSLTNTKAMPTDVLGVSAATILTQNNEALTATVASTAGVPTGSVTFLDGTTTLNTVALTSGVAVLNTTTLAIGSHSITAVYSGDTDFLAATSTAEAVAVLDFSLAISTSSGSVTSATVVPGGTATYLLVVSPVARATTFPAVVNLTATGLPPNATYTLTPSSISAGSGTTNVTLTIGTSAVLAMNHGVPNIRQLGRGLAPFTLALLLLPFTRRAGKRMARLLGALMLLAAGLAAAVGMSGCGLGAGYFGQAPTTYTISVTGTSGSLTHSTTVTLTVE